MFLKYVRKYWLICLLTSVMVIAETVAELLQPQMMSDIVDKGVLAQNFPIIFSLGVKMVIIVIAGGLTGIAGSIFGNMAGQNVGYDLRRDLFERTMRLSFDRASEFTAGSLVNRLSDDVTRVQDSVKVAFRGIARYAFMLVGGIIMLYGQSPVFALISLCGLPFVVFFVIFFLSKSTKMFSDVQKKLDGMSNIMQEDVHGARVIKAYVREEAEASRFEKANEALFGSNLRVQSFLAFLSPSMNIVLNLCVAAIILAGGINAAGGGSVTPGAVMAGITYFAIILTGASVLGNLSQTFIRARASWARVKAVLTCEITITDGTYVCSKSAERGKDAGERGAAEAGLSAAAEGDDEAREPAGAVPVLEFDHVSFRYPDAARDSLSDVSFRLYKGKTLGIIGPTGCGKTSLANLIPRFYDATEGNIFIDGINVRDYRLSDLRDKVSYVLQGSELYSRSIGENILWGNELASEEQVKEAAKVAQALDFIEACPEGFDTQVTEGGHSLSGGQKQRIAIARAVLKGSELLIMDDATSALDLKTERALYEALRKDAPRKARIIITQRIASIMDAEMIAVMEDGRVRAMGTHERLLEECELYREIFNSQLKGGAALG